MMATLNDEYHNSTNMHTESTAMGVFFQNFDPPLFAGFSLCRTKIRPKISVGMVLTHKEGHF